MFYRSLSRAYLSRARTFRFSFSRRRVNRAAARHVAPAIAINFSRGWLAASVSDFRNVLCIASQLLFYHSLRRMTEMLTFAGVAASSRPTPATIRVVTALLGDLCTDDKDCTIPNSECSNGGCICSEGYAETSDRQECFGETELKFCLRVNPQIPSNLKDQRSISGFHACTGYCPTLMLQVVTYFAVYSVRKLGETLIRESLTIR